MADANLVIGWYKTHAGRVPAVCLKAYDSSVVVTNVIANAVTVDVQVLGGGTATLLSGVTVGTAAGNFTFTDT